MFVAIKKTMTVSLTIVPLVLVLTLPAFAGGALGEGGSGVPQNQEISGLATVGEFTGRLIAGPVDPATQVQRFDLRVVFVGKCQRHDLDPTEARKPENQINVGFTREFLTSQANFQDTTDDDVFFFRLENIDLQGHTDDGVGPFQCYPALTNDMIITEVTNFSNNGELYGGNFRAKPLVEIAQ